MRISKGAAQIARLFFVSACLPAADTAARELVGWDGAPGVEGLWTNPVNWTSDQLPADDDDAQVWNGGIVRIDSAVTTGSVGIAEGSNATGTLRVTGGSLTTTLAGLRVGSSIADGSNGTLEQTGGDIVMNAGALYFGFSASGGSGNPAVGTYNLSGGTVTLHSGTSIFAVGLRGTGFVNQTGGTVYARGNTVNTLGGEINLGRNDASAHANGTYTLSGGLAAARSVRFGNTVFTGAGSSTNTFNLQGTGALLTDRIATPNTAATNAFNFTGGTLTATTVNLPTLTNDGGTLNPSTLAFSGTGTVNDVITDAVGTTTINGTYAQRAAGALAIDIRGASASEFDRVVVNGAATVNGVVNVNLLDGFDPALGQTFDVLTAIGGLLGAPTAQGTTPSGRTFLASAEGNALRLTVVPEPGTAGLLALAAAGLLGRHRRRRVSAC